MIEKNRNLLVHATLLMIILLPGSVLAQEQQISLLEERTHSGEREGVVYYQVSDDELTTGIGFRVHFASSNVNVLEITNYLELSNVGIQVLEDTEDLDQNPHTDFYINAAWVDLNGEWPGTTTSPVKLYSFKFDAIEAQVPELFSISQSSLPVGFEFVSTIFTK